VLISGDCGSETVTTTFDRRSHHPRVHAYEDRPKVKTFKNGLIGLREVRAPLRAFGDRGQETTLTQLDAALRDPRLPPPHATARARSWARKDAEDLAPELDRRADAAKAVAEAALAARGREQAASLRVLLQGQRDRILAADKQVDDPQLLLFEDEERKQLRLDRAHRNRRLQDLEREIEVEPGEVEKGYRIVASRLDPVGLVYLWPVTG
jgi:hypothetical protein